MLNPIVAPTDTIRRATVADAEACADIVGTWLTGTTFIETPPSQDQLVAGFCSGIPQYHVWVIGDPIAGYLSFGPDEALIRGFYTASPGSGYGKRLLDHIKSNRDWLQLWTHEPNTRAHAFYEREGFTFSGKTRPGDDGPLELHMTWSKV